MNASMIARLSRAADSAGNSAHLDRRAGHAD